MTQVLISICIPTYNGEAFLKQCLDSCLDQSFTDFEIVICDDCSQDKTCEMIEAYQKKHSKIRFFKNEINLGLVGNWNKCIAQSSGTWIKFVFQDDYITKDCLNEFAKVMDDSCQLIVSQRHFILPEPTRSELMEYYEHTVRTLENSCTSSGNRYLPKTICSAAIKNMSMNFIAEPSLTCFKKSIVKELGLYQENLKQICDLEFVLRIASKYGLTYIAKKLCAFRIHDASTTNSNVSSKYFELKFMEPVLFSCFLLFDPHFQSFRDQLNVLQKIKLKLYFRVKTIQAAEVYAEHHLKHEAFDDQNTSFVEIKKYKKGNLLSNWLAKFI